MSARNKALMFLLSAVLTISVTPIVRAAQRANSVPDLTGQWLLDVKIPNANGAPRVTITQTGNRLTGHYSGANIGEAELKGTIKESKFAFTVVGKTPDGPVTLTYTGTLTTTAEAISGNVEVSNGMTGTFTGKRQ